MKKGNGILGGLIFLIIGIGILWWNEGNNVNNIKSVNEGLKNYNDIKSTSINNKYDGKLVATNGTLSVNSEVTDDEFNISAKSPILYRKVEMYQWIEDCDDNDSCSYKKEWSEKLIDSSEFTKEGHNNPDVKPYESEQFINDEVKLGAFTLPDKLVSQLSTKHKIKNLNEESATNHQMTLTDNYYYTNVSEGNPEIGNIRISFYDNNTKKASVLAEQIDDSFKVYKTKKSKDFFKIYEDVYDGADMLSIISKQNKFGKWFLRIVGALLVIASIGSLFNPLTSLTNKIPVLGNIVNGATGTVSFILGLSISLIVIAIAWLRFRPLISIILLAIVIILIIVLKFLPKKEK